MAATQTEDEQISVEWGPLPEPRFPDPRMGTGVPTSGFNKVSIQKKNASSYYR